MLILIYLVTIATHWLEFFSSNYRVNEEQFRLEIDLKNKNKQTNEQKRRNFLWKEGAKRGVVKTAVSILNLFSMLKVRENLRIEGKREEIYITHLLS